MLSSTLYNFADMIMKSDKNTVKDKEIIVYGLKSAVTQGLSIMTTAALGCVFGLLGESMVFLVSFSAIRMYAGGYHCQKAIHCYVMSSGIMVLVLTVVKVTPTEYMIPISLLILLVSIPIILKLAPVGATNKPLDEVEKLHYRKITIRNLIVECCIILVLFVTGLQNFAFVMSLGIVVTVGVVVLQRKITNKI